MRRRSIVVEGPLAFRMARIGAAQRAESGLQIFTLPLLAARLAGGFSRPARSQDLDPAIRTALQEGGFTELERVRHLPGTTRSIARTLAKVWQADLALDTLTSRSARLAEFAEVERRVRASLPPGVLTPRDLRDVALARVAHAPAMLGAIEIDRLTAIAPVWRPLLAKLATTVTLTWRNPGTADVSWFAGQVVSGERQPAAAMSIVTCANPRAEAVEALRWMRELIASGRARPEEIAICATATEEWDEHFLVLVADADLPLHFSHGVPVLASRDGQACAALADVLLNGLRQDRIRRLFGHAASRSRALAELPATWSLSLQPGAALFELDQWRRALDEAAGRPTDGIDPRPIVMPVLELLAQGPGAAAQAGAVLLGTAARALWTEALRRAPAEALEFSLHDLCLPDGRDPGTSAVWCPASHLVGAPRPWVRLLGMTSRSWPRRAAEDPLIPAHVLPRPVLDPDPVTEHDRRAFVVITGHAARGCVLSRSRRNAQGGQLSASPLLPQDMQPQILKGARIPQHAFSEVDRLLARPDEAAASPALAAADLCWRDWRRPGVTAHDGQVRADHPQIARAIGEVQSATSLRLMLRDPLAFVWRYALGWRAVPEDDQPLTLDARAYGELVHDLLKRTVNALEPVPGYARASRQEIEAALAASTETVRVHWPLERAAPPTLLWQHTLTAAAQLALKALTLDETFQSGTRSWTELAFGSAGDGATATDLPWRPDAEVTIPGTEVRIRGSIDRLDLTGDGRAVRVSDYKTGAEPRRADEIVLGRGTELQRVIYAIAARQLLPESQRVIARLVFLADQEPKPYRLPDVDQAIAELAEHVTAALVLLRNGHALPGPDAREEHNDFRIALPASATTYLQTKNAAFTRAFGEFARIWGCR
ncbi:PD-(D/E)XK nuclease family protein [Sinorhizobium garamanticum]|uniref:PD-(D/E)XK nuclease family protein n=1 Tax=Sinorhizobium garamanticum TaxID=680247 RepID=A0ABY8D9U4_9HYPH|nr:PD-(D/E)XK nuclease family protein [Sinorhizobium garamanticum]WEX85811.1 PD-(D/E)XK nuclease family protein [Sinorhizobium garamanticum]